MKFQSMLGVYRKDLNDSPVLYLEGRPLMQRGEFCWWQGLAEGSFVPLDEEHPNLWYVPPESPSGQILLAPMTTNRREADKLGDRGRYWHWDGNWQQPTVSPSIGVYTKEGGRWAWHGYLKWGTWEACE